MDTSRPLSLPTCEEPKFEPVILTEVPPANGPDFGLNYIEMKDTCH